MRAVLRVARRDLGEVIGEPGHVGAMRHLRTRFRAPQPRRHWPRRAPGGIFGRMITRRGWLAGGMAAALALAARRALAIGPGSKFRFGQLQLGAGNVVEPAAERAAPAGVGDREAHVDRRRARARARHADQRRRCTRRRSSTSPASARSSCRARAGIEALRRFLTFGGFLLIDSAEGSTDGAFDGSVRKLIAAVFPPPARRASRSSRAITSSTSRSTCSTSRSAGSRSRPRWKA